MKCRKKIQICKKQFMALIVGMLLTITLLVSFVFLVENELHNCVGEECGICHELLLCRTLIKTLYGAAVILVIIFGIKLVCSFLNDVHQKQQEVRTLISLKVKLLI